ncbi:MAG TPA: acyltransferase [Patescibacteria group bacterium]|nr:acyltransferase [Patescibacteria group bacterium]
MILVSQEAFAIAIPLVVILLIPQFKNAFFTFPHQQTTITAQRNQFLDAARGIAMLAVIGIHVIHFFYYFNNFDPLFLTISNNLLRFAMPFFFIISGILVPAQFKDTKTILRYYYKKCITLIIPYLCITIVYDIAVQKNATTIIIDIFTGNAVLPYYFIIVLFQLFILAPFLTRVSHHSWFVLSALFISFASLLIPHTWQLYGFPIFLQYLFFFAYGMHSRNYFLAPFHKEAYTTRLIPALIGLIVSILCWILIPVYSYNIQFIYGISVFFIFYALYPFLRNTISPLSYIGQKTLWIYLTHFGVLYVLFTILTPIVKNPIELFTIIALFGTVASLIFGVLCEYLFTAVSSLLYPIQSKSQI